MKKYLLMILTLTASLAAYSQVVLKVQFPLTALTLKSQLWNVSVVNTSNETLHAHVEITFTNALNNQVVFKGTTRLLYFPKGLTQLSPNTVVPVTYNVMDPLLNVSANQDDYLPFGIYNICYTVIGLRGDAAERMAEECETVEIEPLSPPLLVHPSDSASIDEKRPVFSWLPPGPLQLTNNLNYEFRLVEVAPTQSGADAVQKNIPLHIQHGIYSNSLPYPTSLPDLESAKLYAWQVSAASGAGSIIRSEIWTFRLSASERENIKKDGYYVKLTRNLEANVAIMTDAFRFSYSNESADSLFQYNVYDITEGKRKQLMDLQNLVLRYGNNLVEIDFSKWRLLDKHIYQFELFAPNKELWYVKFQFRKL